MLKGRLTSFGVDASLRPVPEGVQRRQPTPGQAADDDQGSRCSDTGRADGNRLVYEDWIGLLRRYRG
jgi:hypothetical protein